LRGILRGPSIVDCIRLAVMRQCVRRRIQLADVPSEALVAKPTRFRHYIAIDQVIEGCWARRRHMQQRLHERSVGVAASGGAPLDGASASRPIENVHPSPNAPNNFTILTPGVAGSLALEPPLHIHRQSHQHWNRLPLGTHVSNSDSSDIDMIGKNHKRQLTH
jgi:hypothetical protein